MFDVVAMWSSTLLMALPCISMVRPSRIQAWFLHTIIRTNAHCFKNTFHATVTGALYVALQLESCACSGTQLNGSLPTSWSSMAQVCMSIIAIEGVTIELHPPVS